jgi:hypothetical protein
MNRSVAFRSYLRGLLLGCGGLLLLVVALNALINPFNLYDGPRMVGFNHYKYELFRHSRLGKAAEVRRRKPDCLILGSSRAQFGLDPGHPAWRDCNAYNLALGGGSMYEVMRYFQHARTVHAPQEVVLALDLFMFNAHRALRQPGYTEERLMARADGNFNPDWRSVAAQDLFTTLLSWRALNASFKTVFPPYLRQPPGPENGFWEYRRFGVDKPARRGQREQFLRNERAFLTEHWFPAPHHAFVFRDPVTGVEPFSDLRTLLRLAYRERIRVTLLFSPAHARQWETLFQAGLWPAFEDWKRRVVRINEEEARIAQRPPYRLWDFSGFDRYTMETVPAADDRQSVMRWYWESSHYRQELGERVLDRVLGQRGPAREPATDFGVILTGSQVDAHLAHVRKAHLRWRATHREDTEEIAQLVRETADWRHPAVPARH